MKHCNTVLNIYLPAYLPTYLLLHYLPRHQAAVESSSYVSDVRIYPGVGTSPYDSDMADLGPCSNYECRVPKVFILPSFDYLEKCFYTFI